LQRALSDFLARARKTDALVFNKQAAEGLVTEARTRLNVIIPAYRDTEITRACIESVLRDRLEQEDRLIIIDDCSPEPDMEAMLNGFRATHNVFILRNDSNLGFVKSVNRGLKFCNDGDVLLLNSDTRLFPGCLNALWQVAHSASDIGTVTALSNNATIFSYPHISLRSQLLADISWEELAAIALDRNRGKIVDVPTGHGFCLLIRRDVLRRVGELDEIFGRGYGEENDLCSRAADLGYRNVAACAAIVEHVEGVSFANDKTHLLSANVKILETRYPEYSPIIMEAERCDVLRIGRWALDAARLERMSRAGERFALVVCHDLGGGTNKAIADIEETVGYGNANKITLRCRNDGYIELKSERPAISALFAAEEIADLLQVLSGADIGLVVVHQVLGFSADFINGMADWIKGRRSVFYAHDFYPLCPRVTMIDAVERFCDLAPTDVCKRCLALSGAHSSSRLDNFSADQHRAMFGAFLSSFSHVVAPSQNAAHYYRAVFPQLRIDVISHPAPPLKFPAHPRAGTDDEIVLFGAIGPHKGSADLLELVHLARLTTPSLRFRVIGYTNRDDELRKAGNVSITGAYKPADLPTLASRAKGRLALFLPGWPETFSYTLTEAVQLGFIPLVPDIGAPAERVMAAGLGAVFEFPIVPSRVLALIADIASGKRKLMKKQATPSAYSPDPQSVAKTKAMFGV
jgi:GT2 family glycosyltransferase/glycosyltransferase involved in cell wall biosynthesis